MDELLDKLKTYFTDYIQKVDNFYIESTKGYSSLFGDKMPDKFYRAISYIIRQFLESDENEDSLFIQVPVDELAVKPNDQVPNFLKLEDAIVHTLSMAVYPESIKAPKIEDAKEGTLYYTADEIKGRPRLWQAKIARTTQRIYPDELFKDRGQVGERVLAANTEGLRNIFNDHLNNTYKLSSLPENFNKPTQEKMVKMANFLAIYEANKTNKRYNNALLIGYGNPENPICNHPYVEFPLEFTNKYNNISNNKEYDIIVCAGDRYYLGYEMGLNQRLATETGTKKIIYIGTIRPQDFQGKTFSFSYREMYHYFGEDEFPTFQIHNLQWPEFNELFENISNIFSNDCLNTITDIDKIKRCVNSYIIYQYLAKGPEEDSFQQLILNFINTNYSYSIDNDQWNFLEESFEKLSLPDLSQNPKTNEFGNIKKVSNNSNSQYLFLSPSQPYKDKIKSVCNKNKSKNTFAIDVHIDSHQYIDIAKVLFERLALGTFHMVSFFKLEKISNFLLEETKVYNQEYRKKILENITYTKPQTSQQEYGSLDNFRYDLETLNDWLKTSASTTYYIITDENNKTYDVCGDVIRYNQLIDADKLFEYKEDWLPCELSFYQRPENFQELRDILYDLPNDGNIDTYSNLWKERLKTRCHNTYQGNCTKMINEDKIEFSQDVVKKTVKDKYKSKFPKCYYRLFNRMKVLGILTENEHNYCIRAQKANDNAKSVGRNLKKGIYEYALKGHCSISEVNTICSNSASRNNHITIDDLKNLCIKTITIKEIKKSNKKHHDDE